MYDALNSALYSNALQKEKEQKQQNRRPSNENTPDTTMQEPHHMLLANREKGKLSKSGRFYSSGRFSTGGSVGNKSIPSSPLNHSAEKNPNSLNNTRNGTSSNFEGAAVVAAAGTNMSVKSSPPLAAAGTGPRATVMAPRGGATASAVTSDSPTAAAAEALSHNMLKPLPTAKLGLHGKNGAELDDDSICRVSSNGASTPCTTPRKTLGASALSKKKSMRNKFSTDLPPSLAAARHSANNRQVHAAAAGKRASSPHPNAPKLNINKGPKINDDGRPHVCKQHYNKLLQRRLEAQAKAASLSSALGITHNSNKSTSGTPNPSVVSPPRTPGASAGPSVCESTRTWNAFTTKTAAPDYKNTFIPCLSLECFSDIVGPTEYGLDMVDTRIVPETAMNEKQRAQLAPHVLTQEQLNQYNQLNNKKKDPKKDKPPRELSNPIMAKAIVSATPLPKGTTLFDLFYHFLDDDHTLLFDYHHKRNETECQCQPWKPVSPNPATTAEYQVMGAGLNINPKHPAGDKGIAYGAGQRTFVCKTVVKVVGNTICVYTEYHRYAFLKIRKPDAPPLKPGEVDDNIRNYRRYLVIQFSGQAKGAMLTDTFRAESLVVFEEKDDNPNLPMSAVPTGQNVSVTMTTYANIQFVKSQWGVIRNKIISAALEDEMPAGYKKMAIYLSEKVFSAIEEDKKNAMAVAAAGANPTLASSISRRMGSFKVDAIKDMASFIMTGDSLGDGDGDVYFCDCPACCCGECFDGPDVEGVMMGHDSDDMWKSVQRASPSVGNSVTVNANATNNAAAAATNKNKDTSMTNALHSTTGPSLLPSVVVSTIEEVCTNTFHDDHHHGKKRHDDSTTNSHATKTTSVTFSNPSAVGGSSNNNNTMGGNGGISSIFTLIKPRVLFAALLATAEEDSSFNKSIATGIIGLFTALFGFATLSALKTLLGSLLFSSSFAFPAVIAPMMTAADDANFAQQQQLYAVATTSAQIAATNVALFLDASLIRPLMVPVMTVVLAIMTSVTLEYALVFKELLGM